MKTDIIEIKKKRDKLEVDLFDLVYQFTKETNTMPYEIRFSWVDSEIISEKRSPHQLIDCIVKIEI